MRVCSQSDLGEGVIKRHRVSNHDILMVNLNGRLYALSNWCTHEEGDLSRGEIEDECIVCEDHGAKFGLLSGEVVEGPLGEGRESIEKLRTFEVKIQEGDVFVSI
ncbi:MAG: Rieske (2Fe-2S) protein [Nitrososphaerales archaeon]